MTADRPPGTAEQPSKIRGLAALLTPVLMIGSIVGLGLGAGYLAIRDTAELRTEVGGAAPFHPDGWQGAGPPADGDGLYNPVEAGEQLPSGFRQVIARDVIRPVYTPRFVAGADIDWPDDELIIGVDLAGEARAYPVGFLNRREIVVDIHRGIPTFVTW